MSSQICPTKVLRNSMKEKIKAAIKAKFPALNLRAKRLDEITAKIEAKVKDESEIDAQIDAFNEFFPLADIAKMDDKVADLESKLKKAANPPKKTEETETDDDSTEESEGSGKKGSKKKDADEGTPAWAKKLVETTTALTEKVTKLEAEKLQTSILDQVTTKLKDVPKEFGWDKRALPTKAEEIDDFVKSVNEDYQAFSQKQTESGFSAVPKPKGGSETGGKKDKADEKEVAAIVDTLMPGFENKKAS
jgi:disulfide oxidoreductase YuzD